MPAFGARLKGGRDGSLHIRASATRRLAGRLTTLGADRNCATRQQPRPARTRRTRHGRTEERPQAAARRHGAARRSRGRPKGGLVAATRRGGTHHDARVLGAANDGGEDGAGRIITGEAGLAHAGAIVNDEGLDLLSLQKDAKRVWKGGREVSEGPRQLRESSTTVAPALRSLPAVARRHAPHDTVEVILHTILNVRKSRTRKPSHEFCSVIAGPRDGPRRRGDGSPGLRAAASSSPRFPIAASRTIFVALQRL